MKKILVIVLFISFFICFGSICNATETKVDIYLSNGSEFVKTTDSQIAILGGKYIEIHLLGVNGVRGVYIGDQKIEYTQTSFKDYSMQHDLSTVLEFGVAQMPNETKSGYLIIDNGKERFSKAYLTITKDCTKFANTYLGNDGECHCNTGYEWALDDVYCVVGFMQDVKPEPIVYPNICMDGYVQQGSKCITHTKLCRDRFGTNVYGESPNGESKLRTGQTINDYTICYCDKGYIWEFAGGYCVDSIYDDGIPVTEYKPIDEYDLFSSNVDFDGDGIPNEYDKHPNGGDAMISRTYDLADEYKNAMYNSNNHPDHIFITVNISEDRYNYYKEYKNHAFTADWANIDSFVIYDDPVIIDLVNQFYVYEKELGVGTASMLAHLLVNKIIYTDDINSGWDEYPKYPIETLVDAKGDCEDTSFLMAALLKAMNMSVVLVKFSGHLAIADATLTKEHLDLLKNSDPDIYNEYFGGFDYMWRYNSNPNNTRYLVYIETTGRNNWNLGIMPEELWDQDYVVYEIRDYKDRDDSIFFDTEKSIIKADSVLIDRLKGYILLQVEAHGEAWYVNQSDQKRYYMKDGATAYQMMRSFGLGITDADLGKIPAAGTTDEIKNASSICGSNATANRLKGKILLQVQQHGEAYYVYPKNCRMIYMKDGAAAYEIMRYLGLGITNLDLEKIPSN